MNRSDYSVLVTDPYDRFLPGAFEVAGTDEHGLPVLRRTAVNRPYRYFDFTGVFDPEGQDKVVRMERLAMVFEALRRLWDRTGLKLPAYAGVGAVRDQVERPILWDFIPHGSTAAVRLEERRDGLAGLKDELSSALEEARRAEGEAEAAVRDADRALEAAVKATGRTEEALASLEARFEESLASMSALSAEFDSLSSRLKDELGKDSPDAGVVSGLEAERDSVMSRMRELSDSMVEQDAAYRAKAEELSEALSDEAVAGSAAMDAAELLSAVGVEADGIEYDIACTTEDIALVEKELAGVKAWAEAMSGTDRDREAYYSMLTTGVPAGSPKADYDSYLSQEVSAEKDLYRRIASIGESWEASVADCKGLLSEMQDSVDIGSARTARDEARTAVREASHEVSEAETNLMTAQYALDRNSDEQAALARRYDSGELGLGAYWSRQADLVKARHGLVRDCRKAADDLSEARRAAHRAGLDLDEAEALYGRLYDRLYASGGLRSYQICEDPLLPWRDYRTLRGLPVDGPLRLSALWLPGIMARQMAVADAVCVRSGAYGWGYNFASSPTAYVLGPGFDMPQPPVATTVTYSTGGAVGGAGVTENSRWEETPRLDIVNVQSMSPYSGDEAANYDANERLLSELTDSYMSGGEDGGLEGRMRANRPFPSFMPDGKSLAADPTEWRTRRLTRDWLDRLHADMGSFVLAWTDSPDGTHSYDGSKLYHDIYRGSSGGSTESGMPLTVVSGGVAAREFSTTDGYDRVVDYRKNDSVFMPHVYSSSSAGQTVRWYLRNNGEYERVVTPHDTSSSSGALLLSGKVYAFVYLGDRFTRWFRPDYMCMFARSQAHARWTASSNEPPKPTEGSNTPHDSYLIDADSYTPHKLTWTFCGAASDTNVNIIVSDPGSTVTKAETEFWLAYYDDRISELDPDSQGYESTKAKYEAEKAEEQARLDAAAAARKSDEDEAEALLASVAAQEVAVEAANDAMLTAGRLRDDAEAAWARARDAVSSRHEAMDLLRKALDNPRTSYSADYLEDAVRTAGSAVETARAEYLSAADRVLELGKEGLALRKRLDDEEASLIKALRESEGQSARSEARERLDEFRKSARDERAWSDRAIETAVGQRNSRENGLDAACEGLYRYEQALRYRRLADSLTGEAEDMRAEKEEAYYSSVSAYDAAKTAYSSLAKGQYKSDSSRLDALYSKLDGYFKGDRPARPYAVFSIDATALNVESKAECPTPKPEYSSYHTGLSESWSVKLGHFAAWMKVSKTPYWETPADEPLMPSETRGKAAAEAELARKERRAEEDDAAEMARAELDSSEREAEYETVSAAVTDFLEDEKGYADRYSEEMLARIGERVARSESDAAAMEAYARELYGKS